MIVLTALALPSFTVEFYSLTPEILVSTYVFLFINLCDFYNGFPELSRLSNKSKQIQIRRSIEKHSLYGILASLLETQLAQASLSRNTRLSFWRISALEEKEVELCTTPYACSCSFPHLWHVFQNLHLDWLC